MNKINLTSIGVLIVLVLIFVYVFVKTAPPKPPETIEVHDAAPPRPAAPPPRAAPPCGCVFDIDKTLTCGDPAGVVQMCKDNGCVFGLNTARNMPYADDVPLKEQGFPPNVLNGEDFIYNRAPTYENVVPTKVEGLRYFQHKWKIESPSKILFFDDNLSNIEGANAAGFKGVWCPTTEQQCGVGADQEKIAAEIFRQNLGVR